MSSHRRSRAVAVAAPDLGALDEAGWMAVPRVGRLLHRGTRNRSAEPRPALQRAWRKGH